MQELESHASTCGSSQTATNVPAAEWRDPPGLFSPRSQRKGLAPSDLSSSWAFSLLCSCSTLSSRVLHLWLTANGTFVLVRNWARFDGDAVASVPSGW